MSLKMKAEPKLEEQPAASGQPALVRVENVVKHFATGGAAVLGSRVVHAVDGVSFEIYPDETLGLVGESGCGKSTLGRVIVQLEPATSGKVFVQGQELTSLRGERLRRARQQMQMIFQDPYASLDPRMTVGDIVELASSLEIYARPRHPYTKALLSSIPVPDPDLQAQRKPILLKGEIPSPVNPPSGCRFHTRCPIAQFPICAEQDPALEDKAGGHLAACHFSEKVAAM